MPPQLAAVRVNPARRLFREVPSMAKHERPGYGKYVLTLGIESDVPMAEVAKRAGFSRAYLSAVLMGHKAPTPRFANAVVNGLGLNEQQAIKLHRLCAEARGWRTR
jgi:cyanate lyase